MWLAHARRTAVTLVTGSVVLTGASWGILAFTAGTTAATAAAVTPGGSESCEPLQATAASPSPSATKTSAKPTASPTTTKATATPTPPPDHHGHGHADTDAHDGDTHDGDTHVNSDADTNPGADPGNRRYGG